MRCEADVDHRAIDNAMKDSMGGESPVLCWLWTAVHHVAANNFFPLSIHCRLPKPVGSMDADKRTA